MGFQVSVILLELHLQQGIVAMPLGSQGCPPFCFSPYGVGRLRIGSISFPRKRASSSFLQRPYPPIPLNGLLCHPLHKSKDGGVTHNKVGGGNLTNGSRSHSDTALDLQVPVIATKLNELF